MSEEQRERRETSERGETSQRDGAGHGAEGRATPGNGVAAFTSETPVGGEVAIPGIDGKLEERRRGGWYTKLVAHYLKRNLARRAAREAAAAVAAPVAAPLVAGATPHVRALSAIRWACAKSAVSGAVAG